MRAYICINSVKHDHVFMKNLHEMFEVVVVHAKDARPSKKELIQIVKNYEVVICGIQEQCDEDVAAAAVALKVLATLSAGTNHIAVSDFQQKGVRVLSVPTANAISVAEHTIALILALYKRLRQCDHAVRQRLEWNHNADKPTDLCGKILGILGAGTIAYRVAEIAKAFQAIPVVWTFHPDRHHEFEELGVRFLESLTKLFEESDIVTIHLPLTEHTRHLITRQLIVSLDRSRPLVLINTSRAELIEPGALLAGLNEGILAASGLDVYYEDEVRDFPEYRVLLTPHLAGLTTEATMKMRSDMIEAIRRSI